MDTIVLTKDLQIGKIVIKEGTELGVLKEDFRRDQVLFNTIKGRPGKRGGSDLAISIMSIADELQDPEFIQALINGLTTGAVY